MTNKKIDFSSLYMKSTYDAACLKTENDFLKDRIYELEAALEKAAIMAQEKWHSWPAEEISAAIRELKNERKLHKSPPNVFTT